MIRITPLISRPFRFRRPSSNRFASIATHRPTPFQLLRTRPLSMIIFFAITVIFDPWHHLTTVRWVIWGPARSETLRSLGRLTSTSLLRHLAFWFTWRCGWEDLTTSRRRWLLNWERSRSVWIFFVFGTDIRLRSIAKFRSGRVNERVSRECGWRYAGGRRSLGGCSTQFFLRFYLCAGEAGVFIPVIRRSY